MNYNQIGRQDTFNIVQKPSSFNYVLIFLLAEIKSRSYAFISFFKYYDRYDQCLATPLIRRHLVALFIAYSE